MPRIAMITTSKMHLQWSIESEGRTAHLRPTRFRFRISNGVLKVKTVDQVYLSGRGVIFAAPKPMERVEPNPKSPAAARARHISLSMEVSNAL